MLKTDMFAPPWRDGPHILLQQEWCVKRIKWRGGGGFRNDNVVLEKDVEDQLD
jgi:hypothetical protein